MKQTTTKHIQQCLNVDSQTAAIWCRPFWLWGWITKNMRDHQRNHKRKVKISYLCSRYWGCWWTTYNLPELGHLQTRYIWGRYINWTGRWSVSMIFCMFIKYWDVRCYLNNTLRLNVSPELIFFRCIYLFWELGIKCQSAWDLLGC